MDGPTLFDSPADDDDVEVDDRLVSGAEVPSWHPSFGPPGTAEYQHRVRLAAGSLSRRRGTTRRRRLAIEARRRANQRLDDPRASVREGERSRRRLLRLIG